MSSHHWINRTGITLSPDNLNNYLGFIYRLTETKTGKIYIGRKQFWSKRGRNWYESDWRYYTGSSNIVNRILESDIHNWTFEIIGIFTSKSLIRYAEAYSIISSGSYPFASVGYNGGFEGCRGRLRYDLTDEQQLKVLKRNLQK